MEKSKELKIKQLKERFPKGTRLKLLSMDDIQAPMPGTCGTVTYVDDMATIHMNWDNGSSLGLIYGEDKFAVLKKGDADNYVTGKH